MIECSCCGRYPCIRPDGSEGYLHADPCQFPKYGCTCDKNPPKLPTTPEEWDKLKHDTCASAASPMLRSMISRSEALTMCYEVWNARHKLAEQECRILLDSKLEQIRIHKINTEQWQAARDTANALLREAEGVISGFGGRDGYEKVNALLAKLRRHLGDK